MTPSGESNIQFVPEHQCPACKRTMDVVMILEDDEPYLPEEGDISICGYCLVVNVFTDTGQLRLATSEECEKIPHWVRVRMAAEQKKRQRVF